MRVRTSRRTGWPTASHMRRIWRLRPSWMTMRITPGATTPTGPGRSCPSSRSTPWRRRRSAARTGHALDLHEVLLLDPERRMGEALGQVAVVGEHEQALAVGVEPPHREHAGLVGHEVEPPWADRGGRGRW